MSPSTFTTFSLLHLSSFPSHVYHKHPLFHSSVHVYLLVYLSTILSTASSILLDSISSSFTSSFHSSASLSRTSCASPSSIPSLFQSPSSPAASFASKAASATAAFSAARPAFRAWPASAFALGCCSSPCILLQSFVFLFVFASLYMLWHSHAACISDSPPPNHSKPAVILVLHIASPASSFHSLSYSLSYSLSSPFRAPLHSICHIHSRAAFSASSFFSAVFAPFAAPFSARASFAVFPGAPICHFFASSASAAAVAAAAFSAACALFRALPSSAFTLGFCSFPCIVFLFYFFSVVSWYLGCGRSSCRIFMLISTCQSLRSI